MTRDEQQLLEIFRALRPGRKARLLRRAESSIAAQRRVDAIRAAGGDPRAEIARTLECAIDDQFIEDYVQ